MTSDNPFEAPGTPSADTPTFRLFSTNMVAGATFLGSPVAGGILLFLNAQRLGVSSAGVVATSAAVTVALFVLALVLPDWFPGFILAIASIMSMRALAESAQGEAVRGHAMDGGPMAPWWQAALVGLGSLVVVVMVVMVVAVVAALALGV